MTAHLKYIVLSAVAITVCGLACATQAQAGGDAPVHLPPPPEPIEAPASWTSSGGWYLRGDIGARWYRSKESNWAGLSETSDLRSGLDAGLGLGYKAGFLRVDVTGDYALPVDYKATTVTTNDTTAKLQMSTVLGNLYFDLGTWGGLTPYIGAGAGVGFSRVTEYTRGFFAYTGPTTVTQSRFAYAGMAGLAMKVAPNLQFDLGYRYLNYGDVKLATETIGDTVAKKVVAHEVRLGLRWSFDDLPVR